jgi:ribosomal protein L18E
MKDKNKKMEKKISKTKIEKRIQRKKDPSLVKTIIQLKKTNPEAAKELSKPKRRWPALNLKELAHVEGDLLVCGKILSAGEIAGAKKVVAWSASNKAIEKIKENNGSFVELSEELKKNPELNGLVIVK